MGIAGDDSTLFYDAKMDQWGITPKQDDETLSAYFKRVLSSNIFDSDLKDICVH